MFFLFFVVLLGKHHSQNHETQNANAQTAGAQDVSFNAIVVLAVIHGTLVCVIDATTDAVSNVSSSFHGIYLSLCFSLL